MHHPTLKSCSHETSSFQTRPIIASLVCISPSAHGPDLNRLCGWQGALPTSRPLSFFRHRVFSPRRRAQLDDPSHDILFHPRTPLSPWANPGSPAQRARRPWLRVPMTSVYRPLSRIGTSRFAAVRGFCCSYFLTGGLYWPSVTHLLGQYFTP